MSVKAIEKASGGKGKRAAKAKSVIVAIRTEWRTGSGTATTPWRILRDDPKNGVYELTNWIKTHGVGKPRRWHGRTHWSRTAGEEEPLTVEEFRENASRYFPELTDEQQRQLDALDGDKKLNALYERMAFALVISKAIEKCEISSFLEFMHDENRRKVAAYDPFHAPRFVPQDGGRAKPATLETFVWSTAQQSGISYLRYRNSELVGGNIPKVCISFKSKEDAEFAGEISEEIMHDDGADTIAKIDFACDYQTLRDLLPSELHRTVLDGLLLEKTDLELQDDLELSKHTLQRKLKSKIQIIADTLGFEPSDEDAFIDKLYSVRRKLRRHREAREKAERDALNNQNGVKQ